MVQVSMGLAIMETLHKVNAIDFYRILVVPYPQDLFCQHPPIHVRTTNPLVDFFPDSFSFFFLQKTKVDPIMGPPIELTST